MKKQRYHAPPVGNRVDVGQRRESRVDAKNLDCAPQAPIHPGFYEEIRPAWPISACSPVLGTTHPRRQAGMSHTRQLGPSFYPGRSGNRPPYTACDPITAGLPHGIYAGYSPTLAPQAPLHPGFSD